MTPKSMQATCRMSGTNIRRELRGFFTRKIVEVFPSPSDWIGKRVLDVGTGKGFSAIHLAGLVSGRVYSVEPFKKQLERARKNLRRASKLETVKLVKGWAENLPCPSAFFDVIVTYGSLHDFKDVDKAFREFNRVLKGNGIYVATEPTRKLSELLKDSSSHILSLEEVRKLLLDSNFLVIDTAESDNNLSFFVKAQKSRT